MRACHRHGCGHGSLVEDSAIRTLLLVRAVEENDPHGELLPLDLREQAVATMAPPQAPVGVGGGLSAQDWRYLCCRAAVLFLHLPGAVQGWLGHLPGRAWLGWVWVLACAAGAVSHWAGLGRAFNLLGGPLLAVLCWNLAVYLVLGLRIAVRWFRRSVPRPARQPVRQQLARWLARLAGGPRAASRENDPSASEAARAAYEAARRGRDRLLALPLAALLLHGAAAAFALGLLAAVYLRGISQQYQVVWESTWLGPQAVGWLMQVLLGPAAALTGIGLPTDAAAWEALRAGGGPPQAANPWIHLFAVSIMLFVVTPRLLLAGWAALRLRLRAAKPPDWPRADRYARRLLSLPVGESGPAVAVLGFGFRRLDSWSGAAFRNGLAGLIRDCWGRGGEARWLPPAAYGEESEVWEEQWRDVREAGAAVLVMDASATPEDEVHGEVLAAARQRIAGAGKELLVVLELAAFPVERRAPRLAAWNKLAARHQVTLLPVQDGGMLQDEPPARSFVIGG
jgi:hypothetical protein